MTRQEIFIRGLTTKAIIGVHDHERLHPQPLIIDLQMTAAANFSAAEDKLTHTFDYEAITIRIDTFVRSSEYKLLETLAHHLVQLLETEFQLQHYRLTIAKPEALANTTTVGVIIDKLG